MSSDNNDSLDYAIREPRITQRVVIDRDANEFSIVELMDQQRHFGETLWSMQQQARRPVRR